MKAHSVRTLRALLKRGCANRISARDGGQQQSQQELHQLIHGDASASRLQSKIEVGAANDPLEHEADRVADAVVNDTPAPHISNAHTSGSDSQQSSSSASRAVDDSSVSEKEPPEEEQSLSESVQPLLRKTQDDEELPAQASLLQGSLLQAKGEPELSDKAQQKIQQLKGTGSELPEELRQEMEQKIGADFSAVRIHIGPEAASIAQEINARAFTIGNEIFFNNGEYDPKSEEGKKLIAHELTHVVQQSSAAATPTSDASSETAQRDGGSTTQQPPPGVTPMPSPSPGVFEFRKDGRSFQYVSNTRPKELRLPEAPLPRFKRRHADVLQAPLTREPGERSTDQRNKWRDHFNTAVDTPLNSKLATAESRRSFVEENNEKTYFFKLGRDRRNLVFGNREAIKNVAIYPFWDKDSHLRSFQVDHRREDQLGGDDDVPNYEYLESSTNGSSGSRIGRAIGDDIGEAVSVFTHPYYQDQIGANSPNRMSSSRRNVRTNYRLVFNRVSYRLENGPHPNSFWSVNDITTGEQLNRLNLLTPNDIDALEQTSDPMVFLSPSGGRRIRPPAGGGRERIWPRLYATGPLQVDASGDRATLPAEAFRVSDANAPNASYPGLTLYFRPVPGMGANGWALDKDASKAQAQDRSVQNAFQSLRLPGMSPVRLDTLDIDPEQGFVGQGKLLPDVPIFRAADIDVVLQNGDIRLQKTFEIEEINVPSPFSIDHASVTAFAGTDGLGLEGELGIGIDRLGEGELRAEISTANGLSINGEFNFDERIFGEGTQAQVRVGYENDAWSMGGTISIPEGKVPGVSSATINVDYSQTSGFSASGEAELDVPGVESGRLEITHNEEEGFSIGGEFSLSGDTPGIRSGSVSARVREKPDGSGYAVSASGTAVPDIPGVNSNLTIDYNDGAFTAEVTAQYQRGMLSGQIHAGVTNRSVDEETGELSETAEDNNPLVVFGGGSLTLQLAPWLQGTAGVRFAPNGEITVTGEIGLPDELEIFARRELNKDIFNIAVQAPIVPGIVAEVGGGLSATAGIGPGVIDRLSLGVEYNPDREQDTRITGDAHLNIPADAGLRLSVRAGIGLGITGASATGGLEIGGTLGISGAAEAGVHVEWTPAQGLDLRANVGIHAQPGFTFDISGYVSVRALGFSVYDERWQLASYTFGSDYRFGINLPIHYQEGQPFDISLNDVEFEVPNINTNQLLRGLISRIS